MKCNRPKLTIAASLLVVGLVVLLSSLTLANSNVQSLIHRGVDMPEQAYWSFYLPEAAARYRVLGAVIALIGGIGCFLSIDAK